MHQTRKFCIIFYVSLIRNLEYEKKLHTHYAYMTMANWLYHTDLFAFFYYYQWTMYVVPKFLKLFDELINSVDECPLFMEII